ncbi:gephyrin-like molybdotransferase Glp [Salibacterium halotolerans]|uniref:Molybdopterin molybdenumtransferase n=1 Tax=Salibacterium halotolerans TaxID=1884432 RepID=A0A1I5LLX4_9BACI|nr:gephyrin-like molybdotransferase Glp [Salibacterium halotolerans]SFO97771.1 molybdopterin molybdotransferase [Salibacterium halotolerans]
MMEKRTPMPVQEAVAAIMEHRIESRMEWTDLQEASGRYLAQDIQADHDVPPFDRSPYDGFAVRAYDTLEASRDNPVSLHIAGDIGAGSVFGGTVEAGEAVRIMTGAPIPDGCDAVVMLELAHDYEKDGHHYIDVKRPFHVNDNISFRGEDTKRGTTVLQRGTVVHPGVTAVLASFGYAEVPTVQKPHIGVIATGSELLDIREPLQQGKIRNSNAYMIMAQIEQAGGEAVSFGTVSDDFDETLSTVQKALHSVDILLTTGGVSVGDYDYIPDILNELGASVHFNKVSMRPGSVTTAASLGPQLIYGLSGNPSACYVGFELFVRPVIQKVLGSPAPHLKKTKAVLGADFPKPNPFMRFVRAELKDENGGWSAYPAGLDKSSSVTSLSDASALIVLPGGTRGYEKGMDVDILLLHSAEGSEWPWDNIVRSYRS